MWRRGPRPGPTSSGPRRSASKRKSSRTYARDTNSATKTVMGHVTKEELAEINEELTETLQRLDQENTELMKEVKTGAIDDLEEKRDAIMDDLEGAQEAVNAAVREQQETAAFTIMVSGLTALIAAAGILWMQKAGVDPMYVTVGAGTLLAFLLVVKWVRNRQASKDLDTLSSTSDRF